jgi:hypothetical protein
MSEAHIGGDANPTRNKSHLVTEASALEGDADVNPLPPDGGQHAFSRDFDSAVLLDTRDQPFPGLLDTDTIIPRRAIRIPSDPKRTKCSILGCSTTFRYPKDLSRHVLSVHYRETSFACPFIACGRSFGRKDNLRRHQRIHNGKTHAQDVQQPVDCTEVGDKPTVEPAVLSLKDLEQYIFKAIEVRPEPARQLYPPQALSSRSSLQVKVEDTIWEEDWALDGDLERNRLDHDPRGLSQLYKESDSAVPEALLLTANTDGIQHSQMEVPSEWKSFSDHKQVDLSSSLDQDNDTLIDRVSNEPVHNETSQAQKPRATKGTVIPCPLGPQHGCPGRDENMASLE